MRKFGISCGAIKNDPEHPCDPTELLNDFAAPSHFCWRCIPFSDPSPHDGHHECECEYEWADD